MRVDPHEPELALEHASNAGPGPARAAVIAADDARQARAAHRIGDRRGEQAAEPAHRRFPAALGRGRMQRRPDDHVGAARRQFLRDEGDQRFRGLRAARIRASKAPGCADQLDLSLHGYNDFRGPRRVLLERGSFG
jgi:hypothetical protein